MHLAQLDLANNFHSTMVQALVKFFWRKFFRYTVSLMLCLTLGNVLLYSFTKEQKYLSNLCIMLFKGTVWRDVTIT